MRRPGLRAATTHLLLFSLVLTLAASPAWPRTDKSEGAGNGEGAGQFAGLTQSATANLFTGTMSTALPILVPPGRKNLTPDLKLVYSSAGGVSPYGYGWNLPLGKIERSTKHGVPRCTADPAQEEFTVDLGGAVFELVPIGADVYQAKVDEAYAEVYADRANNEWELFDRSGMRYRFGTDSDSRSFVGYDTFMDEPNCSFTSRWALNEIQDPNGNTIEIYYAKYSDSQLLYPTQILYGGNPTADGGTADHPFEIAFSWISTEYFPISYRVGVPDRLYMLLDQIRVGWRSDPAHAQYEQIRGCINSNTSTSSRGAARCW